MKGSILCVTRNNVQLTKQAIKSALAQDVECDVLVYDNVSTDGTVPWLRTKPVALCMPLKQKSLAFCWNAGIKAYFGIGSDRVLVINNDVVLRPDTYRLLSEQVQRGREFVTCVSVNSQEQLGTPGDRSADDLWASARPHPDFSCYMITKSATGKAGWFNEVYFPAYCEDNDYHVRMHRAGVKAVCVSLPFLHLGAQTIATATPGERERIQRGAQFNREIFQRTYGCMPGTKEYEELFK